MALVYLPPTHAGGFSFSALKHADPVIVTQREEGSRMETVHVFLKDYAGRDFGGDFEAVGVSTTAGKVVIDLQYCGAKAKKRLSSAAVTIDLAILDRLNAERLERG